MAPACYDSVARSIVRRIQPASNGNVVTPSCHTPSSLGTTVGYVATVLRPAWQPRTGAIRCSPALRTCRACAVDCSVCACVGPRAPPASAWRRHVPAFNLLTRRCAAPLRPPCRIHGACAVAARALPAMACVRFPRVRLPCCLCVARGVARGLCRGCHTPLSMGSFGCRRARCASPRSPRGAVVVACSFDVLLMDEDDDAPVGSKVVGGDAAKKRRPRKKPAAAAAAAPAAPTPTPAAAAPSKKSTANAAAKSDAGSGDPMVDTVLKVAGPLGFKRGDVEAAISRMWDAELPYDNVDAVVAELKKSRGGGGGGGKGGAAPAATPAPTAVATTSATAAPAAAPQPSKTATARGPAPAPAAPAAAAAAATTAVPNGFESQKKRGGKKDKQPAAVRGCPRLLRSFSRVCSCGAVRHVLRDRTPCHRVHCRDACCCRVRMMALLWTRTRAIAPARRRLQMPPRLPLQLTPTCRPSLRACVGALFASACRLWSPSCNSVLCGECCRSPSLPTFLWYSRS